MRLQPSILLSLSFLAAAPPTAAPAQMPADHSRWHLGVGVEVVRFGRVAVSPPTQEGATELRPSGRPAVHLSVGRGYREWDLELEAGWAAGHIEAGNGALSIQDRTAGVSRYRLGLGVARRVAAAGNGAIGIALMPTLDLWAVEGETRLRIGAEARVLVRVPLGSVDLENRIGVGASGNPIEAVDIGEGVDLRGLRSVFAGVGLRFRT